MEPTAGTVRWKVWVATSAQTRTWMGRVVLPSMISNPGREKRTIEPSTEPALGLACTFIRWCSPNPDRTNAERPAIRQLKVPDAAPEPSMVTLKATCEIVAVPPPPRWSDEAAVAGTAPNSSPTTAAAKAALIIVVTGTADMEERSVVISSRRLGFEKVLVHHGGRDPFRHAVGRARQVAAYREDRSILGLGRSVAPSADAASADGHYVPGNPAPFPLVSQDFGWVEYRAGHAKQSGGLEQLPAAEFAREHLSSSNPTPTGDMIGRSGITPFLSDSGSR